MLPRALWEGELKAKWPSTHWDHWMRDQRQHKGRDCIYPEVPRDYHTGIKGTFMDDFHHNHYFKVGASRFLSSPPPFSNPAPAPPPVQDIGYNKQQFSWRGDEYATVFHEAYDARIEAKLRSGRELQSLSELESASGETFILWINVRLGQPQQPFKRIGFFFSIWHEIERGNYDGVHQFWWTNNNYVMIMNEAEVDARFKNLKTPGGKTWQPTEFPAVQE